MEQASVTQASPLKVQLDSSRTPAPAKRLASYTPVLADRVVVEQIGSGPSGLIVVLGKFL